jgi:hypothetical protein
LPKTDPNAIDPRLSYAEPLALTGGARNDRITSI